jgi:hypothetical protein
MANSSFFHEFATLGGGFREIESFFPTLLVKPAPTIVTRRAVAFSKEIGIIPHPSIGKNPISPIDHYQLAITHLFFLSKDAIFLLIGGCDRSQFLLYLFHTMVIYT